MGTSFGLWLSLLLPYGEWEDRERLSRALALALSNFSFRGKPMSVRLEFFECMPEGGGLILTRSKKLGADFNFMNIAVLMFGYRDISAVVFERGLSKGQTDNLGLAWMVEQVKRRTSGQKNTQALLSAIHQSGATLKPKYFKPLARSKKAEFKAEEVAQITEVVKIVRQEYWSQVSDWLLGNVPEDIDQVIVGGGTSEYLSAELKTFFAHTKVSWAAELEEDVRLAFNLPPQKDALCLRLRDVYGLFRYLQSQVHTPSYA